MGMPETCIYILLLDEEIDVWRPVRAIEVSPSIFKISEGATPESGEKWQFLAGEEVVVEPRNLDGNPVLVAVRAWQRSA